MIIITLGDPLSISVATVAKLLATSGSQSFPLLLVGSYWHWQDQIRRLGLTPLLMRPIKQLGEAKPHELSFLDSGGAERPAEHLSGEERGQIACRALFSLEGFMPPHPLAVLTCPINKRHCAAAGFREVGQTEYFQRIWNKPAIMVLAGPALRVGLTTNHIALADVSSRLTRTLLVDKLALFHYTLQRNFGISKPRLVVCGLNPHNGEGGLCSKHEEETIILPAIASYNQANPLALPVAGPMPADSVFWAARHGHWDGVLALYHDQGLGPFKTLYFDDGINVSGGLPYLRVAPDHGPVEDYYLKEGASPQSFKRAWDFAQAYVYPSG